MKEFIANYWPIVPFGVAMIMGFWRIVANNDKRTTEIRGDIKVVGVKIEGLESQIKKQNGRLNTLENRFNKHIEGAVNK